MEGLESKQKTLNALHQLEMEIQRLVSEKSLATLEHKLKQRQETLEYLFSHFIEQINDQDLTFLKTIQHKSHAMLDEMQGHLTTQSDEIIKYKNTGKRIRLYTDIAQQK